MFFDKFKKAIFKNNIQTIVQSGLNKYKDYYGATLLHISAAYGRVDVIVWLFLNKYDIKETDDCGNTALFYATLNSQYETITLLKLFGLSELYVGECRFLSGHRDKYLLNSDSEDFQQNILIASLIKGIKELNKFKIPEYYFTCIQQVYKNYLSGMVTDKNKESTKSMNDYRDRHKMQNFSKSPYPASQNIDSELELKLFKNKMHQELSEEDYDRRVQAAEEILKLIQQDSLKNLIFFSNEATFFVSGNVTTQYCSLLKNTEKSKIMNEPENKNEKLNVWCAMSSNCIIGPYFFDENVDAKSYVLMLQK